MRKSRDTSTPIISWSTRRNRRSDARRAGHFSINFPRSLDALVLRQFFSADGNIALAPIRARARFL